ncbi:IpaD/SipD/SspD family type III secretion system needle tip protein [Proteus sp. FME41]|uniref:IpaD/SipD/SspD family type III secretion system needle tip protein n=1 Tax=Proteus sp. FME41 TaxID=2742608 RepID=UPI0018692123|nr:IpaD/SipD/SspD family type III secretion system needle tip protein [Proteus sp. FME41]
MATVIDSNTSQCNNKINLKSQSSNIIEYNQGEFLNSSRFLLEDVKKEYQYIFLNDPQGNKKLENLSQKEKDFYLDEQYVKNYISQKNSLNEINIVSQAIKNTQPNNGYPTDSLHDLFNDVKQSITAGKSDYLDVLKDIFSKYMNYVNDLREALSALNQYTKAGSKDGYINVDFKSFYDEINKIKDKYDSLLPDESLLYLRVFLEHHDNGSYLRTINGTEIYYNNKENTEAALNSIDKLLKELNGISSSRNEQSIEPNIDVVFIAKIDFSDFDKFMQELSKRTKNKGDILQTEFDLFKKSLDALEKKVNTNLDELSKKYSSANSNYDNFVKIVSSTMNTLLEMAKGFLRF